MKINKEFRKGFDLGLEYQVRLDKNAGHFRGSYFTVSPEYKLNKQFTLLAEMRYATSAKWDRYRYGAGISWREGFGKWRLILQGKYQYETYAHSIPEIGQFPPSHFIRLKAEAGWRASKTWKMYASCEPRYEVTEGEGMLQRVKTTVGTDYEFIRYHTLDIAYSWQPRFDKPVPKTLWILEVTYRWDIPKAKKKNAEPAAQ